MAYSKEEISIILNAAKLAGLNVSLDRFGQPTLIGPEVARQIGFDHYALLEYNSGGGPVRVYIPASIPASNNISLRDPLNIS